MQIPQITSLHFVLGQVISIAPFLGEQSTTRGVCIPENHQNVLQDYRGAKEAFWIDSWKNCLIRLICCFCFRKFQDENEEKFEVLRLRSICLLKWSFLVSFSRSSRVLESTSCPHVRASASFLRLYHIANDQDLLLLFFMLHLSFCIPRFEGPRENMGF